MKRALAAAVLTASVLGAAGSARAEVKRYALVLGANRGHATERDLVYAESDVARMADALVRLGGFPPSHIVRLQAPTADDARAAIVDLNLRIKEDLRAGGEALLFVFYSGHGDARAIHLGPTSLPTDEFSKLIKLSEARLKIFVLDACRSGALTRVKGGRQVPPFRIEADDRLPSEGYAIVTSSAAGENAQESDTLGSSIFTHFFLSALGGAGDTNQDSRVTLGEAYAYAYEQTLKTSMATVEGFQHPTFDFDLRGRYDPVIADLRALRDHAQLTLTTPGDYLVMRADSSETVILEANTKLANASVLVPVGDGRYRIRLRGRDRMYQSDVRLKGGETAVIGPETMRAVPYAVVIRKGGTSRQVAQGPTVSALMHGPVRDGFSPMLGAQFGYAVELPRFSVMPRVGIQAGGSQNLRTGVLSNRIREISVELTALHVFDFGPLSAAPMVSAGVGLLRQRVERQEPCSAPGCVIESNPVAGIFAVGLYATVPLPAGLSIDSSFELVNFVANQQTETRSLVSWHLSQVQGITTYRGAIGLGYRF